MIIRDYTKTDEDSIRDLAKKYDIFIPDDGSVLIAEDDNGKIVGFVLVRSVTMIEPFITENPLAGKKLLDELMLQLKVKQVPIVRGVVSDEHLNIAERYGFAKVFSGKHIIEMNIPDLTEIDLRELTERSILNIDKIN
jgi:hypothetical protein